MDQSQNEFFGYLEMFLRRKWILILSIILGTAIAAFIAYNAPAYYRSTTFILVEQQKIPEAYVTPTDTTPFEQRLSTIQQQVMSRTNLENIIKDFNLYGKGGNENKLLQKVQSAMGIKIVSKPTMESIVEKMREDIEIEVLGATRGSGGDAFRISYTGSAPDITMRVTNTLASLFIEENLKIKEQYAEGTSEFLAKELEKAKDDLEAQEVSIRKFKEKRMGALPEQLDANLRTLDRLQLELQSVTESFRNSQDRKTMLEEQINLIATGAAPAQVASPLEELTRLKSELAALLSVYTDSYPDVIIARNRVKEFEEQMSGSEQDGAAEDVGPSAVAAQIQNREVYANLSEVKSQISMLKARETRIRRQIMMHEKRVEDTPANEQRLTDLTRDYEITFRNYQSLLEKKLNAKLAQNLEKRQKGARFRVVDPANLPEKPFKPNRPMIILFGVMGGGGVGAGLILLLEFLNPAFRKPEDFIGVLDQPVLVSIPIFTVGRRNRSVKRTKVKKEERRTA
jgi:polysaccharide chain length determinant protein (PEP-CTERM system associated)